VLSRRSFLKLTGASTIGWYVASQTGWVQRAIAQVPGGTLDPLDVDKFVTALLIPPVMPRAATLTSPGGKPVDYYEISMRQFRQRILPADLPETTVWGYGAVRSASKRGILLHHAPSLTIESKWKRPVRVKWINDLIDGGGRYLPHLLPVDPTLHWANPPQGSDPRYGDGPRDSRPEFEATPGRYTGPVPIVTHVHGAVSVGDESDGYAEAWYLPAANNIPAGYATKGTWYDFFAGKAMAGFNAIWGPGFATFQYPNTQRESTIWYHDHALGMTRLNVYAGPAGFFLVRGGPEGDKAIVDRRTGTTAVLPGPAPIEGDPFPTHKTYFEIPIAIQDRSFDANGELFYPDSRSFFDEFEGPYIPDSNVSPIWNPEFFGNTIMVNGNTWPYQTVQRRRYRLRFLNGCQSRFLILDFSDIQGVEVWQIGNEGGFLASPVNLTADHGNRLLMGLAERADLIVDFTSVPTGEYVLHNMGPDEPFGGGEPPDDFDVADPHTTGQIMQFRVVPATAADPSTPPQYLVLPPLQAVPAPIRTRKLALIEEMSNVHDGPAEALLGTVTGGTAHHLHWSEAITENPAVGDSEVWAFYNFTADAHPMHIHEVAFKVVDRQAITFSEDEMGHIGDVTTVGSPRPPEAWESGFKDTVIAYPGEVTRVRMRFTNSGQFVWHCHIVEHEDNEMMRPYRIGPVQSGQPST
jgi:FtsP/CotA-like multicopper oxidase with cupredoxin domain